MHVWTGVRGKGQRVTGQGKRALDQSSKEVEDASDRGFAQSGERLQPRGGDGQEGAEHVDAAFPLYALCGGRGGGRGRRRSDDDEIARGGEQAVECGVDPGLEHLEQLGLDARDFGAAFGEGGKGAEASLPHVRVPRVLPADGEEGEEGEAVGCPEDGRGGALEKGGEDVIAGRAEGRGGIGCAEGGEDRREGEELNARWVCEGGRERACGGEGGDGGWGQGGDHLFDGRRWPWRGWVGDRWGIITATPWKVGKTVGIGASARAKSSFDLLRGHTMQGTDSG